jgi:hypothetical protein
MEGNLTLKREANKCFTPNKQIWPEMNQGVPHAINKQVRDFEKKKRIIYLNYTNERWGEKNKKWPA